MMTVAEFLREVRSSTTIRFAEYVEVRHTDKDFSHSTLWKNLGFAASYTLCEFHVNNRQEIDSISIQR